MKRTAFILMAFIACTVASAHDFSLSTKSGQKLYFNVIDTVRNYVELTYPDGIRTPSASFVGEMTLPSQVTHAGKTYTLKQIGMKAFAGNDKLTGIILPSGLNVIGDFAFENCTALQRVMMPGNTVKIGEGAFFRCTALNSLTLGGDWTEVDFRHFRWSNGIKAINLPARITKVVNIRKLGGLEEITVDPTNRKFAAVDGMLYTKDLKTLLACPRAVADTVVVAEGTTAIHWGALSLCTKVKAIVLPASLESFSFKEFSNMRDLLFIVMKNPTPVMTAECNGQKSFLITLANNNTRLVVPKKSLKDYKKALQTQPGDYADLKEHLPSGMDEHNALIPRMVRAADLLTADHVMGLKDVNKIQDIKIK